MPRHTLAARLAALDILGSVLRRHRPLDETLESHEGMAALDERDRGFARLLAVTTLRRLGQLDDLLGGCMDRPLPPKAGAVQDVLRLGACQLLFLGTPPHAAVGTSVDLVASAGFGGHKGLVNAVLRRLDREGRGIVEQHDAARLDTPAWLWDSWAAAYGQVTCRAIAEAHLGEPPLDVTVGDDPAAWAERLGGEVLPTGTVRLPGGGPVPALPGYDDGAWWVQDAAAALPARLFGDVAGRLVADLCAAPGGKTAQLCLAGAHVAALDRSAKRIERLAANLLRLGLSAEMVVTDAAHWRPPVPLDAVLLDAPCSATGTLRRHPDVARLKSPVDVAKLAVVQAELLRAALDMLKPGGILVYCVCSLQPEEGVRQVEALLAEGAPARRVPIEPAEIGGLQELVSGGDLRTLPCHLADKGGMDAFYAARLQRV